MKMTTDHRDALAARIAPLDTAETRDRYRARDIPRGELVKDIDRRYRFDLFYAVRGYQVFGDTEYLDTHIDTALRSIVAAL